MTSGRPAGALGQTIGVVGVADEDAVALLLLLEMALEAQGLISFREHAGIDRAVRGVTADAALF